LKQAEPSSDATKKYKCPTCPKSSNMMSTYRDHQRTHDQTKPFICSICNRAVSQNTNLKQHLRCHNAIKPFKCEWNLNDCTKTFVSKGELESHLRKHSRAHPFAYNFVGCKSKFTTSSSLVKHRRIRSGEVNCRVN
jgi:KRAB domain-containing zinc finger protein